MKTSLQRPIHGGIEPMLAILLGVITLGGGILFWEWHSSHAGSGKHSKVAAHHQHAKSHHVADAGGKS